MANEIIPNNLVAERGILSLLTYNPEKIVEVIDYLLPSDFYQTTHQDIWKAMVNLYKSGQDIDIISIKTELVKSNVNPKPAIDDLVECYNQPTASSGNLMHFAKEIKNKSILREVISMVCRYRTESELEGADSNIILSKIEKEIVDIGDIMKDDRPSDAQGILNEINVDIVRGEESGWKGFDTGFKWLDDQTGGFIPTQCWIVGAYTGIGKTFFILQMILNTLASGAKVMLVSTEMDRKMNMMRLLGNIAGVGTIRMLKGKMDDAEKARILEAQMKISGYKRNLTIYDNIYTVDQIRLKAKKRKMREGLDILFVDFIQNLRGAENIYERMSNAAVELQHIAQELNITIVIASQVNQGAAGWQSKEAIEYKGAGEIAAIADVALWVKKVDEDRALRQVILRKIRHGIPGSFMVRMSFPSGRVIDTEQAVVSNENISEEGDISGQL
jgi:replicative DNA helicase